MLFRSSWDPARCFAVRCPWSPLESRAQHARHRPQRGGMRWSPRAQNIQRRNQSPWMFPILEATLGSPAPLPPLPNGSLGRWVGITGARYRGRRAQSGEERSDARVGDGVSGKGGGRDGSEAGSERAAGEASELEEGDLGGLTAVAAVTAAARAVEEELREQLEAKDLALRWVRSLGRGVHGPETAPRIHRLPAIGHAGVGGFMRIMYPLERGLQPALRSWTTVCSASYLGGGTVTERCRRLVRARP